MTFQNKQECGHVCVTYLNYFLVVLGCVIVKEKTAVSDLLK